MNIEWRDSPLLAGKYHGYAVGTKMATLWKTDGMDGAYRCNIFLDAEAADGTEVELSADFVHDNLDGAKAVAEEMLDCLMKAREK